MSRRWNVGFTLLVIILVGVFLSSLCVIGQQLKNQRITPQKVEVSTACVQERGKEQVCD